jgi:hypothetical protein
MHAATHTTRTQHTGSLLSFVSVTIKRRRNGLLQKSRLSYGMEYEMVIVVCGSDEKI